MKSIIKDMDIASIIKLKQNQLLLVNEEYQRGAVWSIRQEKLLIDSILRGYPIPQFYFHFIKSEVGGLTSERFEVIDGQQRINAIYKFVNNGFKLFDPQNDKRTGLPKFLLEDPCPWGGKRFEALDPELKEQILETQLRVSHIESNNVNEIRELFVRLQAGLPLNAQEKRDAWPGNFSQFIIKTAGKKPNVVGHEFFAKKFVRGTGEKRGGLRQACAQIFMTFYSRHHHGPQAFCNLNSQQIDEFYRHHLDFDPAVLKGSGAPRFERLLDKAYDILKDGKRPPLRVHAALHTILLIDSMMDKFTSDWIRKFPNALDTFLHNLEKARRDKDENNKYWVRYVVHARTNAMEKDTIARRHGFFVKEMLEAMQPLKRRDPKRLFSLEERELLYFASSKKCKICGESVDWIDAEAHHEIAHVDGGPTLLENASLVHKECHPRGGNRLVPEEVQEPDMTEIPWEVEYDNDQ